MSVCPPAYVWNSWTDFTKFRAQLHVAVARSSSGGVALRYVLPVLWTTARLVVMGASSVVSSEISGKKFPEIYSNLSGNLREFVNYRCQSAVCKSSVAK